MANTQNQILDRLAAWDRAESTLDEVRITDIRSARTHQAFASLLPLISEAVRRTPLRATSGLVEQQRWFKKIAEQS